MTGKIKQLNTANLEVITLESEGQSFNCVLASGSFDGEFHFEVAFDFVFKKGLNLFKSQETSFSLKNADFNIVVANLFLEIQTDGVVLAQVFDSHVALDVEGECVKTGWAKIFVNFKHIHIYEYSL